MVYFLTWVTLVCLICENSSSYSLGICVLSCSLNFHEKSWKTGLIPKADTFSTVSLWFPGYKMDGLYGAGHWSAGLDWAQVLTWPLSSNFHSEQSTETWTWTSHLQGSCAQERNEQACCNNITRASVFWAPEEVLLNFFNNSGRLRLLPFYSQGLQGSETSWDSHLGLSDAKSELYPWLPGEPWKVFQMSWVTIKTQAASR